MLSERQHGHCKALPHPRDENFRHIRQVGRQKWKSESGSHRPSLSVSSAFRRKTTMFRLKVLAGGKWRRRLFDNQATELFIQCAILNPMIENGKPETYKVEIGFVAYFRKTLRFAFHVRSKASREGIATFMQQSRGSSKTTTAIYQ